MAKIPKNLTDKDMFKGYVEEMTVEDAMMNAERRAEEQKRAEKEVKLSGLSPELAERLGRMLLDVKLELFQRGIKDYSFELKRDGLDIILTPIENIKPKRREQS